MRVLLMATTFLLCVSCYFLGKANGLKEARERYVPLLLEAERQWAEALDELAELRGEQGCAVKEYKAMLEKLRQSGFEVPDE